MMNLNTIQQEIATLPPDAQQVIFDLVIVLKKCNLSSQPQPLENKSQNWSDFIGCIEAEPDLSINYKTYLSQELDLKYDNR